MVGFFGARDPAVSKLGGIAFESGAGAPFIIMRSGMLLLVFALYVWLGTPQSEDEAWESVENARRNVCPALAEAVRRGRVVGCHAAVARRAVTARVIRPQPSLRGRVPRQRGQHRAEPAILAAPPAPIVTRPSPSGAGAERSTSRSGAFRGSRTMLMSHDSPAQREFTVVLRNDATFRPLEAFVSYSNAARFKGSAHILVQGAEQLAQASGRRAWWRRRRQCRRVSIGTHPVAATVAHRELRRRPRRRADGHALQESRPARTR